MKGCMNCGNISCGNNKKRDCAGCGRWISPEDKIAELERENAELKEFVNAPHTKGRKTTRADYINVVWDLFKQLTKAKELLKQWLQTSKASGCDNINILTDTELFLNSEVEK
jgi:hypothetical protein